MSAEIVTLADFEAACTPQPFTMEEVQEYTKELFLDAAPLAEENPDRYPAGLLGAVFAAAAPKGLNRKQEGQWVHIFFAGTNSQKPWPEGGPRVHNAVIHKEALAGRGLTLQAKRLRAINGLPARAVITRADLIHLHPNEYGLPVELNEASVEFFAGDSYLIVTSGAERLVKPAAECPNQLRRLRELTDLALRAAEAGQMQPLTA